MSIHNICFRGEIRKVLCGYLPLSVAMTEPMESAEYMGRESMAIQ